MCALRDELAAVLLVSQQEIKDSIIFDANILEESSWELRHLLCVVSANVFAMKLT